MSSSPPLLPAPLGAVHWIADLDVAGGAAALETTAARLLALGLPSLQLRAKGRTTDAIVRAGEPLRARARAAGAFFVVNGDLEAAVRLAADGVHLPAAGPTPEEARRAVPDGMRVGASAHDSAEAARAAGADWLLVSPVFPTRSKPGASALGPDGLAAIVHDATPPVWALGGIGSGEIRACRTAGAAGVAVLRALLGPQAAEVLRAAGIPPRSAPDAPATPDIP